MTDHVFRWTEFALGHGTRLLIILLIALLLIRVLRIVTRRLIAVAGSESAVRVARMREQQTQTLAGILYSGGTAIIVIVAVLMALPEFGFNVTPVAAAAGLVSLSIGFGAQHLVHDFINGFFTVLEDQYVVGDIVRIGDVVGRVEHLTLRRTVVRDPQGRGHDFEWRDYQSGEFEPGLGTGIFGYYCGQRSAVGRGPEHARGRSQRFSRGPSWSPLLLDGPRVLGVESLSANGTTVRLQVRTAAMRQDDVARELRRRVQMELAGRGIQVGGVQRMQLVVTEPEARPIARE